MPDPPSIPHGRPLHSVPLSVPALSLIRPSIDATGFPKFAECERLSKVHTLDKLHTTKEIMSKKSLPNIFFLALVKTFAVCEKALCEIKQGGRPNSCTFSSCTRQSPLFCRVSSSCTRQSSLLESSAKQSPREPVKGYFAECYGKCTRQSYQFFSDLFSRVYEAHIFKHQT